MNEPLGYWEVKYTDAEDRDVEKHVEFLGAMTEREAKKIRDSWQNATWVKDRIYFLVPADMPVPEVLKVPTS